MTCQASWKISLCFPSKSFASQKGRYITFLNLLPTNSKTKNALHWSNLGDSLVDTICNVSALSQQSGLLFSSCNFGFYLLIIIKHGLLSSRIRSVWNLSWIIFYHKVFFILCKITHEAGSGNSILYLSFKSHSFHPSLFSCFNSGLPGQCTFLAFTDDEMWLNVLFPLQCHSYFSAREVVDC